MARKISVEAADALMKGYKYKNSNTEVKKLISEIYALVLHGTEIAWHDLDAGDLLVHDGDYPSTVTKERLNALPNVQVNTQQGDLYLNGKMWPANKPLLREEDYAEWAPKPPFYK